MKIHQQGTQLHLLTENLYENFIWYQNVTKYYLRFFSIYLQDILTYYLDLGVDGFRVDAVPYLKEDPQLRDEPLIPGKTYDIDDWNCLDHIYSKDVVATFEIIYEFRDHVDTYAKAHNTETK